MGDLCTDCGSQDHDGCSHLHRRPLGGYTLPATHDGSARLRWLASVIDAELEWRASHFGRPVGVEHALAAMSQWIKVQAGDNTRSDS